MALLGATLVAVTSASEPQSPEHRCAVLHEAADRLACYDQAFGRPAEADDTPPDASAKAGRDFGLSEAEKRAKIPDPDQRLFPDRIEAVVAVISHRATGEIIVTLDNGQVWVQAESATNARPRVGDKIIIRKAAMGSYQLLTPGRVAMRVRRVK